MYSSLERATLYDTGVMSSFADAMLEGGFFRAEEKEGELFLCWDGFETDAQIFINCVLYVERLVCENPTIAHLDDTHISELRRLVERSPLFGALASKEIIVSDRHHAIRPLEHIFYMLRELDLSRLPSDQQGVRIKVFSIINGLYHDVGKAMSVGYADGERIELLMQQEQPPAKDSYRGHEVISTLAVDSLLTAAAKYFNGVPLFGEFEKMYLLFCIRYHHIFSEMSAHRGGSTRVDFFLNELRQVASSKFQQEQFNPLELLVILYVFTGADVLSVRNGENTNWIITAAVIFNTLSEILEDEGNHLNRAFGMVGLTYLEPIP